jgi:sugar/nucleoside kinase (ribokinase family)
MSVTVIGDATLDVTVRPAEPPHPGADVPAAIWLSPGGQGANVAVRLARAGVEVRLATAIGDDAAGGILRSALQADGVAIPPPAAGRSGLVISLLDAAGERAMLSDRVTIDPRQLAAACDGAAWVHCSLYALADDATGDALADVLGSLPPGTVVSAGGGSLPADPALAGRVRGRLSTSGAAILFLDRDEAAALLDQRQPSLPAAADALSRAFPSTIAIVTGGDAGSAAAGPGFAISVPAVEQTGPMVDATGAGDAYAAGVIAALLRAAWPPDLPTLRVAMERGAHDGGRASRTLGAQGRTTAELVER